EATKTVAEVRPITKQRKRPDGQVETYTENLTEYKTVKVTETHVVGGAAEPKIVVWDTDTGKPMRTLTGVGANVRALAVSADCRMLATAGSDACARGAEEVRLWDARTGEKILGLRSQAGPVGRLVFSPDGRHLAGAPPGGNAVTIWSAAPGRLRHSYDRHGGPVCSVRFSPDGKDVASYSS